MKYFLPELGENIESADVVKVLVSVGDTVTKEQSVMELETEKAVLELPSPVAGVVKEIQVQEGDRISVGQLVMTIDEETATVHAPVKKEKSVKKEVKSSVGATEQRSRGADDVRSAMPVGIGAAPSVKRLARELGVDLSQVRGTGPKGRILAEDVRKMAPQVFTQGPKSLPLPDFSQWGSIRRERMTQVRLSTAKSMAVAWATIPHVTQTETADISDIEKLRKKLKPQVEKLGGKLTFTVMALKIVAGALKKFPKFKSSLDLENEEIIYKEYVHVGVAVDTDRGLFVPVVRDVDKKSLNDLSVELPELSLKARERKLKLDEMQGACFTVTNLGSIGGGHFSPIISPPQVAVLGIGRGTIQAVFQKDHFEPRTLLPLSVSYDHRVIDGAEAARFLKWIAEAMEKPDDFA